MKVRGIEIATRLTDAGDGPALLWGHALMGSMSQEEEAGIMPWQGLRAGTPLVRWDARGHGRSEATPSDEDYRWSELAADLWAIADGLGIDKAVVGGVSMGAGTALHAAMLAPERTRGLVLMAPPTAWDTRARQSRLYVSTARLIGRIGLGPLRFFGELAGFFGELAGWLVRDTAQGRLQRSVMRGLRHADAGALQTALRGAALSDLPAPALLERLDVPTLILAWTGDRSHPLSTAEALVTRLPNARLEVAGETSEVEDWGALLQEFLDSSSVTLRARSARQPRKSTATARAPNQSGT